MITELRLINFRNFEELKLVGLEKKNFLVGENGKGKTNILECISLLSNNSITGLSFDELVKRGEDYFFIEYLSDDGNKISFSYTKEKKLKQFMLNNKKISKKKFNQITNKCVIFSPIIMNMMYLSPNLRRSFLDDLLKSSFEDYEKLLTSYKKIIKHRNKTLKNIGEGKSSKQEINFWNEKFIIEATRIYKYRFKIINFLKSTIDSTKEFFSGKIESIELKYNTKVTEDNVSKDIKEYLEKNIDRDIIMGRTPIGPHVDDFEILVDGIHLSHFASRGETKSMILWLKLLEGIFIEKMTSKKPILLIDDLLSELDNNHKDMLVKKIEYYQTFISSITKTEDTNIIIT
ncbi:MAG: DNA replication and repair protein RecF [Candidatus Gracilibacteria bacterium]|nr:DNA replication and repair protein RecF [Candidatus Gracilibacteria bacterium]